MKHSITMYEKPTCSTCRNVKKMFDARGIAFDSVNYIIHPLSKAELSAMVNGLDVPARDLIRTKEEEFKKLGRDINSFTPLEIVALLVESPGLMQRPVIQIRGKYVLGRPIEKIEAFLDEIAKE